MYLTMNNIIDGQKTVYLDHVLSNTMTEIALVHFFSENIHYEIMEDLKINLTDNAIVKIPKGEYTHRKLSVFLPMNHTMSSLIYNPKIRVENKFTSILSIDIDVDKLDHTDNYVNDKVSKSLFTYHMNSDFDTLLSI